MKKVKSLLPYKNAKRTAKRSGGNRAGRRPGKTLTQAEILDAAEEAFSKKGYVGTSLREIASKAKVNQALVHHYFGSKEKLFQAIFLRRGLELAKARLERLKELEQASAKPPAVEEIVKAYFRPAYDLKKQGPGGIAFMQIQSRVHIDGSSIPHELRNTIYDEAMRRYKLALSNALPNLDPETVYWRMVFSIGAYLYTISDASRIAEISGGLCDPSDLDTSLRQLCSFIAGGLEGAVGPCKTHGIELARDSGKTAK